MIIKIGSIGPYVYFKGLGIYFRKVGILKTLAKADQLGWSI